ncbi:hypothetical protein SAMN00768000_1799 [Sulfobacillus thermosulfidooxidans DSM 9293]|uniref:Uncharacterized protein n=1 Tax=Sulfobacillus thermosulfidooxidans (strain DSM 9293 / VKM B-1269 / AT-1) TaxID=929705 RepID=A0A1W1WG70_SULTA|nr:hypothetical protein [Sulfobacillus thermosulfidooxidans]SMC04713.1 hypothetical protein SAMN00768000_1799 [Sulfobacillus thermosulfidooxidans DSM 9293]
MMWAQNRLLVLMRALWEIPVGTMMGHGAARTTNKTKNSAKVFKEAWKFGIKRQPLLER